MIKWCFLFVMIFLVSCSDSGSEKNITMIQMEQFETQFNDLKMDFAKIRKERANQDVSFNRSEQEKEISKIQNEIYQANKKFMITRSDQLLSRMHDYRDKIAKEKNKQQIEKIDQLIESAESFKRQLQPKVKR